MNNISRKKRLLIIIFVLAGHTALPQIYIDVDNLNDSGNGSLRSAIDFLNSSSENEEFIIDMSNLDGQLTLTSPIDIKRSVTILGSGKDKLSISGNNGAATTTLFNVAHQTVDTSNYLQIHLEDFSLKDGATALNLIQCNATISNVDIKNCFSEQGMGVVDISGGTTQFFNCQFENNISQTSGGAIYGEGSITIEGCTFINNTTSLLAGAVYWRSGEMKIINSTFINNFDLFRKVTHIDGGDGYGLVQFSTFNAELPNALTPRQFNFFFSNCLFYNYGPYGESLGGNLFAPAKLGSVILHFRDIEYHGYPLGTLDYHGGSTLVYELLEGSLAIDNGFEGNLNLETPEFDQRGFPRKSGFSVDIGAFEFQVKDTDSPTAPLLSLDSISEATIELTWTPSVDNTGVTGYDVYNGADLLGTTSGLNFLADNLNACTEYTFSVAAKDAAGNTAASNDVIATTTDETPPVIPVIEDLSDCSITLTPPITADNCVGEISGTTTDPLSYDIPGTYVVTWSFDDGNGNISTTTQNIEIIGYPEPAFSVASPSCFEKPTTFIDNSTNVAPDATYLWDFGDGNTSSQKGDVTHNYTDNLGIYTVSLTISSGTCENSYREAIVQDRPPVLSLVISQEISAPGAGDGAIDLSYIGKGVMTFQWSNGETTEDIQNLPAGTYSVIVTNQEGCSSEAEITLNDPEVCYPADEVAFSVPGPACQGASITFIDNSVNVDPEATYLWDFGDGNTSSQKGDATHEYTDNSRLYTVTLTISNGACIESFSNVFTPGTPPLLSLSVTQEISAPGGADGAIDLTIEGKGPFTHKWSNGATTEDIAGLPAGTYSVVVTNVLGCSSETEITLEEPTGSCFMDEIVSFKQGRKRNGGKISKQRSNPEMALGAPQENDTYNFVALGFGGSITLKLGQDLYDDGSYQPDFILVETSFGRADQMCYSSGDRNYPEMAFLEVSQDNEHWYSLPNVYCRTSFVDISPAVEDGLSFVRYLRITDASNKSWFEGSADGFDIDGIITCQSQVLLAFDRLTNARTASGETSNSIDFTAFDPDFFNHAPNEEIDFSVSVFPNPVDGQWLHLEYNSENIGMAKTRIVDLLGKTMIEMALEVSLGIQRIDINVSALPPGNYFLRLESDEIESSIHKIVKY